MSAANRQPIRVLVVDDEESVREAYRKLLAGAPEDASRAVVDDLRARLFAAKPDALAPATAAPQERSFEAKFCSSAKAAVQAARDAVAAAEPFNVAFIDMRMPPGADGAWAAAQIRAIDPLVEIVICTAYSDVDPRAIGARVPHGPKLLYLQKPFHPNEVLQMALALGEKRLAVANRAQPAPDLDAVTGLLNRAAFMERLSASMDSARRQGHKLALLDINLNGFRRVNTSLGHELGDEYLRLVAQRLGQHGAHGCARLGADEFVVLLSGIGALDEASGVAINILAALAQPARLGQHDISITASVGIATFDGGEADAGTLLRHASVALQQARAQGRSQLAVYEDTMDLSVVRRFSLENHLHQAMERDEFSLVYQPQLVLSDGQICGMEALLRWNNPMLGMVSPAKFIPVAEETGLILPLGEWVLRTACSQLQEWRLAGLTQGRMAVNVSGRQFRQPGFAAVVAGILDETGLPAGLLEIEITESVLMSADARTQQMMAELRSLGVTLAIDDFGTEYSSLSRLAQFPINRLKIDRSFVHNMNRGASGEAVVTAVIQLAKALGLTVVAEGVEEPEQLLMLQGLLCDAAQGYLLGRPLPAEDIRQLLAGLAAAKADPVTPANISAGSAHIV
ncbi:MAG: EAL domain-containing protein [Steroidobacteraceae bacterium]